MTAPANTECLHDATVREIVITIDDRGDRQLRIRMRCNSDCGCVEWNDKLLDVVFHDPVVVLGELLGHMANPESCDSWNDGASEAMAARIGTLRAAGLDMPPQVVELVLHSGSTIEVAYRDVEVVLVSRSDKQVPGA